jgi:hypothetical protein
MAGILSHQEFFVKGFFLGFWHVQSQDFLVTFLRIEFPFLPPFPAGEGPRKDQNSFAIDHEFFGDTSALGN